MPFASSMLKLTYTFLKTQVRACEFEFWYKLLALKYAKRSNDLSLKWVWFSSGSISFREALFHLSHFLLLRQRQWRPRQQRSDWLTEEKWSWRTIHMRHLLSALKSELSFIVPEPINNSNDYKHLQSYNISADCQQSTVRKHLSHEVSHLMWFRCITWHIT